MNTPADPRQALELLASEYSHRVEAIRGDLNNAHSANFAEQAAERQNDDVLRNLLAEAEDGLRQVQHAQERLEAGHYGECTACGENIAPARLAALPTALLCVNCASQSE